jgi:hypothetical protein
MIAENTARQPLSPIEEAHAFAEQAKAGRSQREIATRVGYSQSHVSKRLKLLRLPAAMQADLETGRVDDDDQPIGRLLIKDALAYADAAGDSGDATFAILAAYKLHAHRPMWKPDQLVREVRREQARRVQHEALTKKAEAEGIPLIADAEKKFGGYYPARERLLDGKKAIAAARTDGTLAAAITDGGLVYYSTAKTKPKKTDNRSPAEQQRITDERERRTAMHARADAAALLAARPPKLPASAADIVDALLITAANDYLQLARKWLLAAGAGPDPDLAPYPWWEALRRGDWKTRVHAAHAIGLARTEAHTRDTYRSWGAGDAAWLARLTTETGYSPTDWEQTRLDAIAKPATPARPEQAAIAYDDEDAMCWLLYYNLNLDNPDAVAEHLTEDDDIDAAQAWAQQLLCEEHGIEVAAWVDGQMLPGRPARIAQFADPGRTGQTGAAAATDGGEADGAAVADGDAEREYRLLYDPVHGEWLVLADDEPIADHDGLSPDDREAACTWAAEVLADAGAGPVNWQATLSGSLDEFVATTA